MKKIWQLSLFLLAIPIAVDNFTLIANANDTTKQVRRCTPNSCTPYRANYERAIANGIIRRPSPVPDENQAIALADRAVESGNLNEAAIRLAQAIVIISEKQGNSNAVALERSLDSDIRTKKGQSLRQFMPLYGRIFPVQGNRR